MSQFFDLDIRSPSSNDFCGWTHRHDGRTIEIRPSPDGRGWIVTMVASCDQDTANGSLPASKHFAARRRTTWTMRLTSRPYHSSIRRYLLPSRHHLTTELTAPTAYNSSPRTRLKPTDHQLQQRHEHRDNIADIPLYKSWGGCMSICLALMFVSFLF